MQDAATRQASQNDALDTARAETLQIALGLPAAIGKGDPLPPFFHHVYFWAPQPPAALGRDGHPKVGGLVPDMGLPRRMWAGGRLQFDTPLRAGIPATKTTICERQSHKQGRSGPLGLVTLRHEIRQGGRLCVTEWQDLVYREDPEPDAPAPVPPTARTDEEEMHEVGFDAVLLFRYSALTFNAHRIHFDIDYARDVEGYPGLIVHGPLLAQHLMLMAETRLGSLTSFSYRATAPLFHTETAQLCAAGRSFWVRGPDGRQIMEAEA
ncbi:acyl dehydratase [Sulfitobacter sp. D35]|uniref:acyl dehydratase n=1 Tax=Sulfitobacter sp. D35 TaxID=3083252 RepID=UPI00296E3D10|nr:acyl dehydratase [Sulfitobacter sp. D35]MDW4500141.1 acyl dehydratase [Sulfitobacter sp. D35]